MTRPGKRGLPATATARQGLGKAAGEPGLDTVAARAPDTAASVGKAPRTERGRRTLRALLDAAAAEFGEKGFHDGSISAITRRAGVALGTFYTYFDRSEEHTSELQSPMRTPYAVFCLKKKNQRNIQ